MLDDRAPHPYLGAGYPRAYDILRLLDKLGHDVVFIPCVTGESADSAARAIPSRFGYRAEDWTHAAIARFVESRARDFDVLWVSRPHNMAMLQRYLPSRHPVWEAYSLVVYDAEAIFSLRAALKQRFYPDERPALTLEGELRLARVADVVAVVSRAEGGYFEERGNRTVVLGSCYSRVPAPPCFEQTRGFLFVGALRGRDSPNADAIAWFCQSVAPLLRSTLGAEFHLDVAGLMEGVALASPVGADIRFLGMVPDLSEAYARHRVFVAPHRFAAGIPIKILEAAANGLPVVATALLAGQLTWRHGREIFSAQTDNAEAFAQACLAAYSDARAWQRVQAGALQRIESDYAEGALCAAIAGVLATRRE